MNAATSRLREARSATGSGSKLRDVGSRVGAFFYIFFFSELSSLKISTHSLGNHAKKGKGHVVEASSAARGPSR